MLTPTGPSGAVLFHSVFVSATFTDLRLEREEVMRFLQRSACIPLGMETFTPGAQPSWDVITSSIEMSDYYILIIKNRYGSRLPHTLAATLGDISYTEAEYNLAQSLGIPTLVLVHASPRSVSVEDSSESAEDVAALDRFRRRATEQVLRGTFSTPTGLALEIATAWPRFVQSNPTAGWTRGGSTTAGSTGQTVELDRRRWGIRLGGVEEPGVLQEQAALRRWSEVSGDTVQVRCLAVAGSAVRDRQTGLPVSNSGRLSAVVDVRWESVFEAVMATLQRGKVKGSDSVVSGVAEHIWMHEEWPEAFRDSMAGAEQQVRRRVFLHFNGTGTAPTESELDEVSVAWTFLVDHQVAEQLCVALKRFGLLQDEGDLWSLTRAGIELYERRILPPEERAQSSANSEG